MSKPIAKEDSQKKFRVTVSWTVTGTVDVYAEDANEAEQKARETDLETINSEYASNSFQVDGSEKLSD